MINSDKESNSSPASNRCVWMGGWISQSWKAPQNKPSYRLNR